MNKKNNAEQLTKQLEEGLIQKKHLQEEVLMDKKSLVHIAHRMKEDKVVYDLRKYNAQKELDHARKQLNIIRSEAMMVGESGERSKLVYDKLVRELEGEQRERQQHLESIREQIRTIEESREVSNARESEIRDIAERAMQDKDDN